MNAAADLGLLTGYVERLVRVRQRHRVAPPNVALGGLGPALERVHFERLVAAVPEIKACLDEPAARP